MQDHPVIIRDRMGLARWGMLPPWAVGDDRAMAARMTNARSETISEKPVFRESWARSRRCLVPANGFYEWYDLNGVNQPYYIYRDNSALMAMAGLWARHGDLVTFTILTREATDPIRAMHHRMPVIFDPAQANDWFNAAPDAAARMTENQICNDIRFHTIGPAVGKVANDDPSLIVPQSPMISPKAATLF